MDRVKVCPVCGFENGLDAFFCARPRGQSTCGIPLRSDPVVSALNSESNRSAKPQTYLEFPWGKVEIEEILRIGRDESFSPIAGKMNEFVSRRHAIIHGQGHMMTVTALESTNPTYLNEKALTVGEPAKIANGDVISFSKHMTATLVVQ